MVGQLRGQLLAACEPMDVDDIRSRLHAARLAGDISIRVGIPKSSGNISGNMLFRDGNEFLEIGHSAAGKINLRQRVDESDLALARPSSGLARTGCVFSADAGRTL